MFSYIRIFPLFLFISANIVTSNRTAPVPLLLLISFDGFRWDYPELYNLPNLNSLVKRGVRVKHIENNFATVTFPLHFTIVTGLYEETHGIVANTIYDPILKQVATFDTMNDTKWWSQNPYSQPIWISNQLSNDSQYRRSGVISWPSTGTPINGHLPWKYETFDPNRKFDSVLKQIISWFNESTENRINFGVVYYPQPDMTGHEFGPISNEMNKTLIECDNYVGDLLNMIDNNQYLKENLNVIITSDHGMEEIKKNHSIKLEDYVDTSLFSVYGSHALVNIFVPIESNIDRIYANLSKIPNYEAYKKFQIPSEYNYRLNVRIGDILFTGKPGYEIKLPGENSSTELLGDHGYDNRIPSMHPIFYAFGPAFRQNFQTEQSFRSVDLYPLMSYILQIEERKTNGSFKNVKHILRNVFDDNDSYSVNVFISNIATKVTNWGITTIGCIILVVLLSIVYVIVAFYYSRQLIYVEPESIPVRYRLLSYNDVSMNNLIINESDNEDMK